MQHLQIIRREIAALDKTDPIRLKGIIKDYLADSRELKNDLLEAVDLGVIEQFIAKMKCSSQKREELGLCISDEAKLKKLMAICKYISGVKGGQLVNDYSVSISKSVKQRTNKKQQSAVVKSGSGKQANSFEKKNWFYTSVAVFVLLITLIIVAVNWKPSLKTTVKKANHIEGVLVNNTIGNNSVQGYYLGTIQTNGIKKRYVLIVDGNLDSLQCELLDYPHFNKPKKYFLLRKEDNKHYNTSEGSFLFKNDSLISLAQPTSDNQMYWSFAKKN